MKRARVVVRQEFGFKEVTITHAIDILTELQGKGATHVRGMYVRWKYLDHIPGFNRAAPPNTEPQ